MDLLIVVLNCMADICTKYRGVVVVVKLAVDNELVETDPMEKRGPPLWPEQFLRCS